MSCTRGSSKVVVEERWPCRPRAAERGGLMGRLTRGRFSRGSAAGSPPRRSSVMRPWRRSWTARRRSGGRSMSAAFRCDRGVLNLLLPLGSQVGLSGFIVCRSAVTARGGPAPNQRDRRAPSSEKGSKCHGASCVEGTKNAPTGRHAPRHPIKMTWLCRRGAGTARSPAHDFPWHAYLARRTSRRRESRSPS